MCEFNQSINQSDGLYEHLPPKQGLGMYWGVMFCFLLFKGIIDLYDGNYILLLTRCSQNGIISLTVTNEKVQKNDYKLKWCRLSSPRRGRHRP